MVGGRAVPDGGEEEGRNVCDTVRCLQVGGRNKGDTENKKV